MGDCRAVVGIDKELFLEDISVVYNEGRPVLRPEKTIVVHFQNRFRAFFLGSRSRVGVVYRVESPF